jgi:eukaryotic-like serine/threonine-protein kinase
MADANRCPSCGDQRPEDAPEGLCPRCLASQAVTGDTPARLGTTAESGPQSTETGRSAGPTDQDSMATRVPTPESIDEAARRTGHWSTDADLTTDGNADSNQLPRGSTVRYFGDYEIQKELGRGGMGVVYQARQVTLNRPVALKMIKAGVLADHAELQRFQNEAEAVALLDHPGIVPVYEVGEHDGQRYFSMKLVEGGNLADQLASMKDNPRAAATLLAETAEAVHHAHMRGILHRDLKPANILVDTAGHPHVTDFGLAKRVEGDVEMTASGAILGTPAYMSPEQAHGRRGSITTATDVYGLGAILYAMLTGKAPFGGSSVMDTLDAVRTRPPEPPKKFNVHVPRDLETICLKCLEKDPRRRYSSAHELAADLNNWLDSRPITARRVGASERAWLWCKRRPAIAALSAATLLAVVVGAAGMFAVQVNANTNLRSANDSLDKANGELKTSNIALVKQRTRSEVREAQAIDAVKRFGDVVSKNAELKNNPTLETLRKELLKEPLGFFESLRTSLQADGDTKPESLARLASAAFDLAHLSEQIGNKQDALAAYRESASIHQRLANADPSSSKPRRELAHTLYNMSILLRATGQQAEAIKACETATGIQTELSEAQPTSADLREDLANSRNALAGLLSDAGKQAEALKLYELARSAFSELSLAYPTVSRLRSSHARVCLNIGIIFKDSGKRAEALKYYEEALAIRRQLVDNDPESIPYRDELAQSLINFADQQRVAAKRTEALESYASARAILEKLVLISPSDTEIQYNLAISCMNVGTLQFEMGKPAEALTALDIARETLQKLVDGNPAVIDFRRTLALVCINRAGALVASGKNAEAIPFAEEALAIQRKLAAEHPEKPDLASDMGLTLYNLARLDVDAGRLEEGRARMRSAVEWQGKALAANPANPTYRRYQVAHLTGLILVSRKLVDANGAAEAERELAKLKASDPATIALDERLAAIAKGARPKDNAERLALAQRSYDTKRFVAAARLWAEALDTDPKLGDNRQGGHRYNAACSAALAGCGQSKDDPPPDDAAKAKLRKQALDWLQAELAVWTKFVETGPPQAKAFIVQTLKHWQEDSDLAGIRESKALETLPEAEREGFRALWAEVQTLRKKAEGH